MKFSSFTLALALFCFDSFAQADCAAYMPGVYQAAHRGGIVSAASSAELSSANRQLVQKMRSQGFHFVESEADARYLVTSSGGGYCAEAYGPGLFSDKAVCYGDRGASISITDSTSAEEVVTLYGRSRFSASAAFRNAVNQIPRCRVADSQ